MGGGGGWGVGWFFFFFQAEDGIRDSPVTGVQTCALPISLSEIKNNAAELLKFAEYNEAADLLDSSLVDSALASVRAHCVKNAGLRDEAIVDKLIDPTE